MSTESRIDSAQPEKTARRKRSREESEPNNDENKKRGRPRLDTQDESAADVSVLCLKADGTHAKQSTRDMQTLFVTY